MELYKNKNLFKQAVAMTATYLNIDPAIIEKDYFVTLILREINNKTPGLIFKGGTSLSKCYKIIDRFSEDIDLTLDPKECSRTKRKKLVKTVIEVTKGLGFSLMNEDKIVEYYDLNAFDVAYEHYSTLDGINPNIKVETAFIIKSYPFEEQYAASYIYDCLKSLKKDEVIKEYNLEPFKIKTQTKERTFIDKTFAICDYYIRNQLDKRCRHIYDLYKLFPLIKFDDNFKEFVNEVRTLRSEDKMCPSAMKGFDVNKCLMEILLKDIFKKDFEKFTSNMIYENIKYDDFKIVLKWIVDSNVFGE